MDGDTWKLGSDPRLEGVLLKIETALRHYGPRPVLVACIAGCLLTTASAWLHPTGQLPALLSIALLAGAGACGLAWGAALQRHVFRTRYAAVLHDELAERRLCEDVVLSGIRTDCRLKTLARVLNEK